MISLYSLIKEQSKLKGRPLKIICDWDETLQPIKPYILYSLSKKTMPFEKYFERFWSRADIVFSEHGAGSKWKMVPGHHYSYIDPQDENERMNIKKKRAFNKYYWEEITEEEKEQAKLYVDPERYEKTPLLSIAKDLFIALKEENLIEELVIFTSRLKLKDINLGNKGGKEKKFTKTFGLFSNTKLEFMEVVPRERGKYPLPYRWHWVAGNHCDFDIMIDDHPVVIDKTKELFDTITESSNQKIFVVPDYKCTEYLQAPNIYHVKQEVSDLKDEDFVKAAEEYKQKQAAKSASVVSPTESAEKETSTLKQPYLYWGIGIGIGICLLGLGIYWLFKKKKLLNKFK